ncbi:hypothetical protein [Mechercharimyces sp. CAU 1602]|uniref:hypothetical protein n=1 Tax=Mechercharimyces sp. CAU 1602 TaxID=2973933 RepID=UPI002162B170|nr:hypothetical protein [Mechercharimyces sp. CAU 1602]MCS1351788.1 hypothetical protein [Mechercharimyces sp. CAU 1602]
MHNKPSPPPEESNKKRNRDDEEENFQELDTVISQRSELVPEEFADGPYGAAHNEEHLGKRTPWYKNQHASPRFTYEDRQFHEGIPRQDPGSHHIHDDEDT